MKDLTEDKNLRTLAMIGGLAGLGAILINIARSQPVSLMVAKIRSKV